MPLLTPRIFAALILSILFQSATCVIAEQTPARYIAELNQSWTIEVLDGAGAKIAIGQETPIEIEREWEATLGENFNGRAIYRTTVPANLPRDLYPFWKLELEAAATSAIVRINGTEVGRHLGGWTPFRCDVTDLINGLPKKGDLEIEIELDELVGHNTQGFLPIVVPHFGGIWKSVRLIGYKSAASLNDLSIRVGGFQGEHQLEIEVPTLFASNHRRDNYQVEFRLTNGLGKDLDWQIVPWQDNQKDPKNQLPQAVTDVAVCSYQPEYVKLWSPSEPFLYELEFRLVDKNSKTSVDFFTQKAAIRELRTEGRKLYLNGVPVTVRGLLNWGYAPPRLSPTLDESWMRDELEQARQRGFNLMKFCLWLPPKRYLELADEMGMLVWMEYPTWHPDFSQNKLSDLKREFQEFFHYDRNHPCILVRSLTCETGPGADLKVIQELYDLAHQEVPGSIVEDDSSWIQWNRISDFYDDHPYGNNHTWRNKLDELDRYITERNPKPLLLGEAIAADTWLADDELQVAGSAATAAHAPLSIAALSDYIQGLDNHIESDAWMSLPETSRRYAWLMRKFQIETFRDRFPDQGYVVSVIRDFPLASMGLIDRGNRWKWSPEDFQWHRERMLVLRTPDDRRGFVSGENVEFEFALIDALQRDDSPTVTWKLQDPNQPNAKSTGILTLVPDSQGRSLGTLNLTLPTTDTPVRYQLVATTGTDKDLIHNHWDLWISPTSTYPKLVAYAHASIVDWCEMLPSNLISLTPWDGKASDQVLLTRRWDAGLWQAAKNGARIVMLPDNSTGSLAVRDHWFLRGGPIAGKDHPFWKAHPRAMYRDLQHFDWSGPVMFDSPLTHEVTPIALLWDNHDLKNYRSHLLAFDCRVGRGRWLASTLGLGTKPNRGTEELLGNLITAIQDDSIPVKPLSEEWIDAIEGEIGSRAHSLANAAWIFSPDAKNEGIESKWYRAVHDRSAWKTISIDRHWESQGYESLDGWGWYYAEVEIPENLRKIELRNNETAQVNDKLEETLYIHFTGADDYFELFIDGMPIGTGGDRELRQTAFELRKSFAIPKEACKDGKLAIAIRILDWQGAGGLFRPVYLSNRPIRERAPVLVEAR